MRRASILLRRQVPGLGWSDVLGTRRPRAYSPAESRPRCQGAARRHAALGARPAARPQHARPHGPRAERHAAVGAGARAVPPADRALPGGAAHAAARRPAHQRHAARRARARSAGRYSLPASRHAHLPERRCAAGLYVCAQRRAWCFCREGLCRCEQLRRRSGRWTTRGEERRWWWWWRRWRWRCAPAALPSDGINGCRRVEAGQRRAGGEPAGGAAVRGDRRLGSRPCLARRLHRRGRRQGGLPQRRRLCGRGTGGGRSGAGPRRAQPRHACRRGESDGRGAGGAS